MLDRFRIEQALLVGIVREKRWDLLILNGIDEQYFSAASKPLYRYIKEYTDNNKYPDIQILAYTNSITEQELIEYNQISDLDGLCATLVKEYVGARVVYEVEQLNDRARNLNNDPYGYIKAIGTASDTLKKISFVNRTSDLFDNIEEILTIDPSNVISTGFKELDNQITGFRKGEDLIVLVGRTGQGKSWLGLKFAMAGALQGQTVGIYSGEMSKQQLQERSLCCAKQTYTTTKEEALEFIKSNDLKIKILTQTDLRRRATVVDLEEMIVRDKLTMLVVDQLSLMEDPTSKPRYTITTNLW